ncbi:MSC_0618 family F1-like ATPase beta subunit [Mycoplasmopsis gallinarum]
MMAKITKLWSDVVEIELTNNEKVKIDWILETKNKLSVLMIKKIINETKILAVIVKSDENLIIGQELTIKKHSFMTPIGQKAKGNIFNIEGESLNTKGNDFDLVEMNSTITVNDDYAYKPEILETGIKAIDFFIPILKGSKIGIFGGAGVGKTVLMKEMIFNLSTNQKRTSSIFVGAGERSREGVELYDDLKESDLMKNSTMYIAQMNERAGARMSIVSAGVTAAEYLRDNEKENVLLFIDNIFRFLQAGSETAVSLDKKTSVGGYQATLNTEISQIENRLFSNQNGSITSFQTVFLPMDDLSDPSAVAVFSHLNGSLVLSREIAAKNIYPSFDPLESNSDSVNPQIIGDKHFNAILEVKKILQRYKELEDVILILGYDELDAESKKVVKKALQLQNFFSQYFSVTQHFTGEKGVFVPLNKTVDSVIKILNEDFIDIEPEKFSYISTTDDLLK